MTNIHAGTALKSRSYFSANAIISILVTAAALVSRLTAITTFFFGRQVAEALKGKCRVFKLDSDDESDMSSTLNVSTGCLGYCAATLLT